MNDAVSRFHNFVVVWTRLSPDTIEELARSVVPEVRVTVRPMEGLIASRVGPERFRTLLLAGFAGIAVLLASVGVFTVLSYLVGRRTQEFGVRMALGATRRTVFAHVFRQALPPSAIGLIIGLGVAYALRESLAAYTFVIQVTDAPTYALVTLLLSAVIVTACAVPAFRASRMDPMTALRYE
jgi:putative ABC transport system permease protein